MSFTNRKLLAILILSFLISINLSVSQAQIIETEDKKALILNTAEFLYGDRYCVKIIQNLEEIDYNVEYLSNEQVDLNFIKNNLTTEIVYMNTHAGYWDTDGDNKPDTIVVATGEKWAENTEQKYSFEYNNSMIIKCEISDNYYIAFTPELIEYYYQPGDFPESLIYMATCDAAYDDSMAEPFLDAGASVFIGWKKTTVSWTNRFTSVFAFRLLSMGFSVKQVCRIVRAGGFFNFLFRTKLTYYGDGDYKL